jgi:hypothetical protein
MEVASIVRCDVCCVWRLLMLTHIGLLSLGLTVCFHAGCIGLRHSKCLSNPEVSAGHACSQQGRAP